MTSSEDDYWDNETDWQALAAQEVQGPAQVTQESTGIVVVSNQRHPAAAEHTASSSSIASSSTTLYDNSVDPLHLSSSSNASSGYAIPHTFDNTPSVNEPATTNIEVPTRATPANFPTSSMNRHGSSNPSGSSAGQPNRATISRNSAHTRSSGNVVSRRNPGNAKRISSILEGLNSPDGPPKEPRKRSAQMARDGESISHSNSPSPRKRVRIALDSYEVDLSCSICLELFLAPQVINPCGHSLCGDCINHWLSKQENTLRTCPICRTPLSGKPIPNFSIANTVQKHIELLRSNGVEEWLDEGAKWKERALRKKTYEVTQAATKVTASVAANTFVNNSVPSAVDWNLLIAQLRLPNPVLQQFVEISDDSNSDSESESDSDSNSDSGSDSDSDSNSEAD
ncbi:hypothetical protein CPB86DRAFT_873048 [Serendipita vermifera]|nr:hypothetical protein CPB86DRAFT_873048 [Serendipita vermifera]